MTNSNAKTLAEKIADSHCQPRKAEMEQEYDMPRADMECLREAFFNHSKAGRSKPDQD